MTPVPFEQFFEHCPGLLWAIDDNGQILHLNSTWEHHLGYSPQRLQGQPLLELLHPEDRPQIQAKWDELRQNHGSPTSSAPRANRTITFVGRVRAHDG
ncbi:MAG: PAS domain-containing protein, partial [Thermostichus sp. HHBFW_bins_43]